MDTKKIDSWFVVISYIFFTICGWIRLIITVSQCFHLQVVANIRCLYTPLLPRRCLKPTFLSQKDVSWPSRSRYIPCRQWLQEKKLPFCIYSQKKHIMINLPLSNNAVGRRIILSGHHQHTLIQWLSYAKQAIPVAFFSLSKWKSKIRYLKKKLIIACARYQWITYSICISMLI